MKIQFGRRIKYERKTNERKLKRAREKMKKKAILFQLITFKVVFWCVFFARSPFSLLVFCLLVAALLCAIWCCKVDSQRTTQWCTFPHLTKISSANCVTLIFNNSIVLYVCVVEQYAHFGSSKALFYTPSFALLQQRVQWETNRFLSRSDCICFDSLISFLFFSLLL